MTLSEHLKSFQMESYEKMSVRINAHYENEKEHVSAYTIGRVFNNKLTTGSLHALMKMSKYCFTIHISEVLQPTMSIQPSTHVSTRRETVNGIEGTSVFYRKKV